MNFQNVQFIQSVGSESTLFNFELGEVLFIGRSNVGKSSLINALTNKKRLAFTSKKPGHTKLLNFYNVDQKIMLVDAPGYGFAKGDRNHYKQFEKLLNNYFEHQTKLRAVLFLLDSRRVPNADDLLFYNYIKKYNVPLKIIVTKVDKVNQSEKAAIMKNLQSVLPGIENEEIILVSSEKGTNISNLQKMIENV